MSDLCRLVVGVATVVILIMGNAMPAAAQAAATGQNEAVDRFLVLVPLRDQEAIQLDKDLAEKARAAALEVERAAVEQRGEARARISQKEVEIQTNKDRRNIAKREGRNADVIVLDAERAALEREKQMLERRETLRTVEIEWAKSQAEFQANSIQALDLERQLSIKRTERLGLDTTRLVEIREDRVIFDLEEATLQAQKKSAQTQRDVARRAQQVVEGRLGVLESQRKVVSGN
jgi:hypothetical protein